MNNEAKIHLSTVEMELVNNTEWIFTKQLIIKKVYHLFGRLNEIFKRINNEERQFLPLQLQNSNGKISKGENYKSLPYVILDYPAIFNNENIFAVRTIFWWGNFFSISLHLSGRFKYALNIASAIQYLKERKFFVCVNKTQWEHDYSPSNFVDINYLSKDDIDQLNEKSFFKISKKIELRKWNEAEIILEQYFREIINLIKISFQDDEIVL